MNKPKIYKCAYTNCRCDEELTSENAVKYGNRYYHAVCFENKTAINEITQYYVDNVCSTVVMAQLGKAVKDIIFKKNVEPRFLLFAIKYAVKNKIPIRSPFSLHYLINYDNIKEAFKKQEASKIVANMREELPQIDTANNDGAAFNFTNDNHSGFGGVFGGY